MKVMAELHLGTDSELPKKFGKQIKKAAARLTCYLSDKRGYKDCRGHDTTRFVYLPADEFNLIHSLAVEYPTKTNRSGEKGGLVTIVLRFEGRAVVISHNSMRTVSSLQKKIVEGAMQMICREMQDTRLRIDSLQSQLEFHKKEFKICKVEVDAMVAYQNLSQFTRNSEVVHTAKTRADDRMKSAEASVCNYQKVIADAKNELEDLADVEMEFLKLRA